MGAANGHSLPIRLVTTLEGPISVAFKKAGREWHAIALQFDIVGTGKTRAEAFCQMQGLFETYVSEVLKASRPVRFYNPSERADWEIRDKAHFHVVVVLSAKPVLGAKAPLRPSLDDLVKLCSIRSKIQSIQLQPA